MAAATQQMLEIDCRNLLCPMPIIKLSQAIDHIGIGDTLRMIATDPGSKHDVEAWARQTSHELVGTEKDGKLYKYVVRRTH